MNITTIFKKEVKIQVSKRFIASLLVLVVTLSLFPIFPAQASDIDSEDSTVTTEAIEDEDLLLDENEPIDTANSTPDTETPDELSPPEEEASTLSTTIYSNDSYAEMIFPPGSGISEDAVLTIVEADTDENQITEVMDFFSIEAVLDYLILDISVPDVNTDSIVTLDIVFEHPYLKTLGNEHSYFAEITASGSIKPIDDYVIHKNSNGLIADFQVDIDGFDKNSRLILIAADQPNLTGWEDYSASYCIRARNYGANLKNYAIGSSDGGLTYHCYSNAEWGSPECDMNDFAICLNNLKRFRGGVNTSTTSAAGENSAREWTNMSTELKEKLILLLVYGMDEDSGHARFTDTYAAYAAMQLVAWEWIRGVRETAFTEGGVGYYGTNYQYYPTEVCDIARELRSLVATNPDSIDPYATKVVLIWPDYSDGQALIAIEEEAATTIREGNLSVTKKIQGAGKLSNWVFELYGSRNDAINKTNRLATARTNSAGVATFTDLEAEQTYYIRESSSQTNGTVGWTLSETIVSGTVVADTTTSVGSITNISPAKISVSKTITPNDFSTEANLAGWVFELYDSEEKAESANNPIMTSVTNSSGIAYFDGLNGGTYYVREAPASRQTKNITGWTLSETVLTVTANAGATSYTVAGSIENKAPAQINGKKSIESESGNDGKLNGWVYQISVDRNFANIISSPVSGSDGTWVTGYVLTPGTYYIREAPMDLQTRSDKENFVLDTKISVVRIAAGQNVFAESPDSVLLPNSEEKYTSLNVEKGKIGIKKDVFGIDPTSSALSDWVFHVYSDEECENFVTSITTDSNGLGVSSLLAPATYWIKEASREYQNRSDIHMWAISEEVIPVTVQPGITVNAYDSNNPTATNFYGKHIRLTKSVYAGNNPDCYNQLIGNDMYTLAGAQYQIVVEGQIMETVTTDENGIAVSSQVYSVETTGYIKEIVAPNGYLLDTREYAFTILPVTEEYCEVSVVEIPTFDPDIQQFKKVDAETGVSQGNTSFEGAVFRWDYYDNANWDGEPLKIWYFKTNEDGYYAYSPDFLADGYTSSDLYKSVFNSYQVPLGSIKITEVESPLGYAFLPELYASVTQPAMGETAVWKYTDETLEILKNSNNLWTGEEPINPLLFGSLSVIKLDKNRNDDLSSWASFEGCEFAIYNRSENPVKVGNFDVAQPGEICYILTIGENGQATTGCILPIGTYEVKEIKGNDYYQCNSDWNFEFSIDGDSNNPMIGVECENSLRPAKINIQKLNTEGTALPGAKFLLEWSLDGQDNWTPVSKSTNLMVGGCSSEELDDNGCLVIGESGEISFENLHPMIYYRITEVDVPDGYQLLKEPILVDPTLELTPENNFERGYRVVNNETFTIPNTGSKDFILIIPCFILAPLSAFCVAYILTAPNAVKKKGKK